MATKVVTCILYYCWHACMPLSQQSAVFLTGTIVQGACVQSFGGSPCGLGTCGITLEALHLANTYKRTITTKGMYYFSSIHTISI